MHHYTENDSLPRLFEDLKCFPGLSKIRVVSQCRSDLSFRFIEAVHLRQSDSIVESRCGKIGFQPDGFAKESIYVFRCNCGWTFIHSVKYGELERKAAEVWRRDMASNWRKNRGIELMQLWQEIPDKMILRYRSIEGIDPSAPLPPKLTTARLIGAILDDEQRQKRSAVFASN